MNATNDFLERTAALVALATGAEFESILADADQTESPIEAMFAAWFNGARDHMLSHGHARFALTLQPQRSIQCPDSGSSYRLDFALQPMNHGLASSLTVAGLELRVGIELDGHKWHERTRQQVAERNQRDRDLSGLGWRILHFSGSELHINPIWVVVEVLEAGASALDQAQAALLHG